MADPKEIGILFQAEMINALLAKRKTQTRRIVKPQPFKVQAGIPFRQVPSDDRVTSFAEIRCPYGAPGRRLWVRESLRRDHWIGLPKGVIAYAADGDMAWDLDGPAQWVWQRPKLPSIHCPRGLSRFLLEVEAVRVERVQDITEGDARAEGCPEPCAMASARDWYRDLWLRINGKEAWDADPLVWVITFRDVTP